MKSFYCKQPHADEQVSAIISGDKTLLVFPVKTAMDKDFWCEMSPSEIAGEANNSDFRNSKFTEGARYWLKETFKICDWLDSGQPFVSFRAGGENMLCSDWDCSYDDYIEGIWEELSASHNFDIDQCAADRKWRTSIHMPQWASRCTIEAKRVYVKRITDITIEECALYGVGHKYGYDHKKHGAPRDGRQRFYESLADKELWSKASWCWFVEFEVAK